MAVAWIGNREARLEEAVAEAAKLLAASQCPVISMDTDVHGARAAIALADRVGAAYDLVSGEATMREAAQLTDRGMMTIAPGETRRRADVLVLVGELPKAQADFIEELIATTPDLSGGRPRKVFAIGGKIKSKSITMLGAGNIAATLAGLRAQLAERPVSRSVKGFDGLVDALKDAKFPVFVWSGRSGDAPALDMLQGLVADINKTRRASTLHLPASENGWASVLASGWSTGFAPRIGLALGMPEYDLWRFDVARMIEDGEADVVVTVAMVAPHSGLLRKPPLPRSTGERKGAKSGTAAKRVAVVDESISSPPSNGGEVDRRSRDGVGVDPTHIALAPTSKPIPNTAVTFAIGKPCVDHDTITFRARLGTLGAIPASKPSDAPSAASILREIIALFDAKRAAA